MVRFFIEELEVYFPYDFVYPEQFAYMKYLKKTLDAGGHSVLEMPTGTGKTVALFSLITSYQMTHPSSLEKLIYCTRTVPEMEKALVELREVATYRQREKRKDRENQFHKTNTEGGGNLQSTLLEKKTELSSSSSFLLVKKEEKENDEKEKKETEIFSFSSSSSHNNTNSSNSGREKAGSESSKSVFSSRNPFPQTEKILGIGLSARRNMCIHQEVSQEVERNKIDERCRKLTAPWIRQKLLPNSSSRTRIYPSYTNNPSSSSSSSSSSVTSGRMMNRGAVHVGSVEYNDDDDNFSQILSRNSSPVCGGGGGGGGGEMIRCSGDVEDVERFRANTEEGEEEEEDGNFSFPDGLCEYYENFEKYWGLQMVGGGGVYTIDEMKRMGASWVHPQTKKPTPFCPYFAARRLLKVANVVVLNYQYILDPKVAQASLLGGSPMVGRSSGVGCSSFSSSSSSLNAIKKVVKERSVVVFDEAHNIDNVCIEALSVNLNRATLERASRNIIKLSDEIERVKAFDTSRLNEEYQRLLQGLQASNHIDALEAENLANPVLPDDIVNEAVPGSIRRSAHFVALMKKLVMYLKSYIKVYEVKSEGPLTFLHGLEEDIHVDTRVLKFCYERLTSLMTTLQIINIEEFTPLTLVTDFFTLLGTYWEGFVLICDPYPEATGLYDPLLQLCCLDASLAMKPVINRYQSIVLTSGTISPLELYPKLLNFHPVLTESFPMSLDRNCICPIIVSRGADQVPLSSKFDLRSDVSVLRNYGSLLVELCRSIPDGLVCFFTSYAYMEQIVAQWYEMGILASVLENKLLFLETKDVVATTLALHNFRRACDCGRGAVFFSVARGKVAEGIDFDRHYGRCVVLFGIPFQFTLSRILKARLDYMRENYQIQENEFLTFDAMRQAAQCVGRVIRSKTDYGLMVFADCRYSRVDKRSKLPPWILKYLETSNMSLTTDTAISVAQTFMRNMSQPYSMTNSTRLDAETLKDSESCWDIVSRGLSLSAFALPAAAAAVAMTTILPLTDEGGGEGGEGRDYDNERGRATEEVKDYDDVMRGDEGAGGRV